MALFISIVMVDRGVFLVILSFFLALLIGAALIAFGTVVALMGTIGHADITRIAAIATSGKQRYCGQKPNIFLHLIPRII
jgi:hypothetical protein